MSKEVGYCPFPFDMFPPCIKVDINQWASLHEFLTNKPNGRKPLNIAVEIDCIEFEQDHISIKNIHCINCMFCVFACPGNYIEIDHNYLPFALCSNFKVDYKDKIPKNELDRYFKGTFINFPSLALSHMRVKYRDFQTFTEKNETKNISVWGANILKFLSVSKENSIGTEIKMTMSSRDRGARLDICLLSKDHLIVAESKTDFVKMVVDGRYLNQMIGYEEEISLTLTKLKWQKKYFKFLLIGGNESDLLPPNHPLCTSKIGDQSQMFYDNLLEHNLFFISATALLCLGILKLFRGDKFSIETTFDRIQKIQGQGLLSCGIVKKNRNGQFEIIEF